MMLTSPALLQPRGLGLPCSEVRAERLALSAEFAVDEIVKNPDAIELGREIAGEQWAGTKR